MNVVLSGAGSALGERLCLHLSAAGHRVFALARNGARLAGLAARRRGRVVPISADIAHPDQITDTYHSIQSTYGPIDALVNASVASFETLWPGAPATVDAAADAAFRGATVCTRLVVPFMLKQHTGRIVSIAPSPVACGFAGRCGVTAWADDLSHELQPYGIIASMLCPAPRTVSAWTGVAQRLPAPDASFDDLVQMLDFLLTRPSSLVCQRLVTVPVWQ